MHYDGIIFKPELNELYHHGIKGQKWGVRRYQNPDGTLTERGRKRYESVTKVNDDLYLAKSRTRGLAKVLSRNENIRKEQAKSRDYDILSKDKKIGNLSLYDVDPKTTNIVWLGINSSERGKKRAQNIMDWVISNETKMDKEFLTLEVPGTSNDARHIYEKKGFEAGNKISDDDDVWGGLTEMKKRLR